VKRSTDVDAFDDFQRTAMDYAFERGDRSVMKIPLDADARVLVAAHCGPCGSGDSARAVPVEAAMTAVGRA
jgi:hypothetical protein